MFPGRILASGPGLVAQLALCAGVVGCGNYCLEGVFNSGGSTSDTPSCTLTKPTGNVAVAFNSSSATELNQLRTPSIFVTLRGIDALPLSNVGEEAASWQELDPRLGDHPMQVDLAASASDPCATGPLGSDLVPAGVYTELRLRLVPDAAPGSSSSLLDTSACGANVFSCLAPPNTAPLPLALEGPAEIVIPSQSISHGFVRILPDTSVHLSIVLDLRSTRAVPADGPAGAVRLMPAFSVQTRADCGPNE